MSKADSTELDINKLREEVEKQKNNKFILLGIFLVALVLFGVLLRFSPELTQDEKEKLFRFPRGADDLRLIHQVIDKYSEQNYTFVLFAFCYLYIFLQSFAIPGPVFLSILSGAIFGGVQGFMLVCFCATTGASCCYGLSYTLGRGLVLKYFPSMLVKFYNKIQSNREHTFFYMLFLRLTPLVPNWFVNISSPIVGMPITSFFFGTFFGLMPLNIIHINAGMTLSSLDKVGASLQNILWIALLGFLALIPTLFKKKIEQFDEKHNKEAAAAKTEKKIN
ncbi:SNARE associated protein (macronuclear) [Tetrahymena thermophila SB210]|uniref:SNARE associated protein n=1 Tax=Tetrahymena thermophila (strain SB210) TaxID=312017 RepID=I7M250_TETTS|nr:SNARE associated protein [Tetrahymena thermophila SB210]EAR98482.2 SNARE associated protein [Tetrahymena thermophila SB210]|eukprot:XP_001018727.2 SNARE associated protein [Tetrahymena thermophila SB210]